MPRPVAIGRPSAGSSPAPAARQGHAPTAARAVPNSRPVGQLSAGGHDFPRKIPRARCGHDSDVSGLHPHGRLNRDPGTPALPGALRMPWNFPRKILRHPKGSGARRPEQPRSTVRMLRVEMRELPSQPVPRGAHQGGPMHSWPGLQAPNLRRHGAIGRRRTGSARPPDRAAPPRWGPAPTPGPSRPRWYGTAATPVPASASSRGSTS